MNIYRHISYIIIRVYEYLCMFIFIHTLRKNGLNLNKYLSEYYQLIIYLQ